LPHSHADEPHMSSPQFPLRPVHRMLQRSYEGVRPYGTSFWKPAPVDTDRIMAAHKSRDHLYNLLARRERTRT